MTQPDSTAPTSPRLPQAAAPEAGRQGRHRAAHQPVPAPPAPAWLPRTALAGALALTLGVGVLATASAAGAPTRQGAQPGPAAAPGAAAGLARLSLGAPKGAKLLTAQPAHVTHPAPATPAAVSGLAANGIPEVALNAYRLAAARLASAQPGCGIQWSLLAGIGRVESNHGRYGGAALSASGESSPHIVGQALDGAVYDYIADTDGGRLDADPRFDHAVGPMQFIPSTWAMYGVDGNGDGIASPFNINDAALAAARYLCAAGGDLRTAAGQSRAVLAYNHSDEYLALVLATAAAYANGTALDAPIQGVTGGALPPVDASWLPPVNPGAPAGAGTATKPPRASSTSHRGSAGSQPAGGAAGTGATGTGSAGTGSAGAGSGGTGSGTGSTGAGSGSTGGSSVAAGGGSPAPTSSAATSSAAAPSSQPSTSAPLPLPLPSLSTGPAPGPTAVCTQTLLGIVIQVPCPH